MTIKKCKLCQKSFDEEEEKSIYSEAGEWLAGEVWNDTGELCRQCLENRAKLAMMYMHEYSG